MTNYFNDYSMQLTKLKCKCFLSKFFEEKFTFLSTSNYFSLRFFFHKLLKFLIINVELILI